MSPSLADQNQTKKMKGDPSVFFNQLFQGRARTQSPTTINYAVEIPTFGEFAGVGMTGVYWPSLFLGEPLLLLLIFIPVANVKSSHNCNALSTECYLKETK